MKKCIILVVVFLFTFNSFSQEKPFWDEIQAFKKQDSLQPPKDGMILFIGSSSFRLWKTLKEDFHNENIVNRAFGGATLLDLIHYQDDVVLKYKPKKIFIYCGENDVASSEKVSSLAVFDRFMILHATLRKKFPVTPIVFVSIKPSILRWSMRERMISANTLICNYLKNDSNATFVNVWDLMLENGQPMNDIFTEDNLHMNAKGYAIWTEQLKDLVDGK
jgi:lysophospholipase L1-like esterase